MSYETRYHDTLICPNCPSNADEQCSMVCPSNTYCNGEKLDDEHTECCNICCFPVHIIASIVSLPFCMCNICHIVCRMMLSSNKIMPAHIDTHINTTKSSPSETETLNSSEPKLIN